MPADSKSKRYSPEALVFVLRVAPVALFVIVTSAPVSTACDLSTIVPCSDALAVACACASRGTISRPASAIPNVNATAVNCFLILTSTLQVSRNGAQIDAPLPRVTVHPHRAGFADRHSQACFSHQCRE